MKKSLLTFFILLVLISAGEAQNGNEPDSSHELPYKKFSPSMVAIIIVLIAALFFMGFFSIYIRNRSFSAPGSIRVLRASFRRRAAASGLDREVINTFPTFNYLMVKELRIGKEALECAVCLNEFEDQDTLRLLPKCDHVFHPECIDEWLSSHVTCPVCRTNLVPTPEDVPQVENEVEISVQEIEVDETDQSRPPPPQFVDRRSKSTNMDRPPRSGSVRSGRGRMFGKFPRSHSTGHSVIQPGQNDDRFTLRFQDEFHRQVMMKRALNRTTSCLVTRLPRESSSRRGYKTGFGERSTSTRVGRSNSRPSDRWVFSVAPPFFTRTPSVRSDTVLPAHADASTSSSGLPTRTFIKLPSFQLREAKGDGMKSTLLPV